ncbi:MAG TPA: heme-binding protein [Xanthomonadaceae bacterium]|nr:heme-binding protein [Xanthomonadaceae bacterium]
MRKVCNAGLALAIAAALSACSGGSNTADPVGTAPPPAASGPGCTGSCVSADSFLTAAEVSRVISQAVAEAKAQGSPATIAVVDRVGNVLGVYRMTGAGALVTITSGRPVIGGLENLSVPSELAAIAKAITGAYLSSEGNAFSTRTASQIVQEHFNPGEFNAPSGPLFGVQFSQLPCSDLVNRFVPGGGTNTGPHRSPLGLSADPGGFPLYKAGVPVGGVGVIADSTYTLDEVISDFDRDLDELVATAATFGFAAPIDRRGDRITVDGKTFRYSDVDFDDLAVAGGATGNLAADGTLIPVPAYSDGAIIPGTVFGAPESGIRAEAALYPGRDAFVLVDDDGNPRYPPRAGTDGASALTPEEARRIVDEALDIANRARAQIRRPLSTPARVSISVVDSNGVVLALARTRDAPIFGIDVSLQKARTAAFFSADHAAADLFAAPQVNYLNATLAPQGVVFNVTDSISIGDYVTRVRDFIGNPTALADGAVAFSDRAGGNLSRPFYPDGIISNQSGPFSRPFAQWSPFHDGLQLDLVYNQLALHVAHYLNQSGLALFLGETLLAPAPTPENPVPLPDPPPGSCTVLGDPGTAEASTRLPNGIQIFPGSVPIYRGGVLVGGVGVSGDGVDQDDMVSFLGLHNAGAALGTVNNAPPAIRADQLVVRNVRLRYVQCPQAPFIGSDEQNVCQGK